MTGEQTILKPSIKKEGHAWHLRCSIRNRSFTCFGGGLRWYTLTQQTGSWSDAVRILRTWYYNGQLQQGWSK